MLGEGFARIAARRIGLCCDDTHAIYWLDYRLRHAAIDRQDVFNV